MGRGKRRQRQHIPLSIDEATSRLSAPVSVVPDPAARFKTEAIRELRPGLEARILQELPGLDDSLQLSEAIEAETPLDWFLTYIVQDEGSGLDSNLNYTIQDVDSESWDCRLVVTADYMQAVKQPTPSMIVDADLSDYEGLEGAVQLAEEIYDACDLVSEARSGLFADQP